MYKVIKDNLGITRLRPTGQGGGGDISEGKVYETDKGNLFLKRNADPMALQMFEGEMEGLKAILATGTIKAPVPYLVVDKQRNGAILVMEGLDIKPAKEFSNTLGEQVARMHLHNQENARKYSIQENYIGDSQSCEPVTQFGFPVTTCCGYIPQNNSWNTDWVIFYARKLDKLFGLIEEQYGDREVRDLWSLLQLKIPQFFKDVEIKPSLLHGDFWSGNVGETIDSPVIFDPAALYGHYEFDLSIAKMHGGFNKQFWESYYSVNPKEKGWNKRYKLYMLFSSLLEWCHFGIKEKTRTVRLLSDLFW